MAFAPFTAWGLEQMRNRSLNFCQSDEIPLYNHAGARLHSRDGWNAEMIHLQIGWSTRSWPCGLGKGLNPQTRPNLSLDSTDLRQAGPISRYRDMQGPASQQGQAPRDAISLSTSNDTSNCVTSITVSDAVKGDLAKWKPADVSWTSFLRILQQTADPHLFEARIQALLEEEEREAVERARARYREHRGDPKAGIKASDLLEDQA